MESKNKNRHKNPRIRKKIKRLKLILLFSFLFGVSTSYCYFEFIAPDAKNNSLQGQLDKDNVTPPVKDKDDVEPSKENADNTEEDPTKEKENEEKKDPEEEKEPEEVRDGQIILSFAGDCTLGTDPTFSGNTFNNKFEEVNGDYSYFFKNVYPIFSEDDLTIVNLEGTLTNATTAADKKYVFKGPPEYANILTAGSVEGVTLANNHAEDFLEQGLNDTKKALEEVGVNHFGLGSEWSTTIEGQKIVFLGYKGWLEHVNFDKLKEDIQRHKNEGAIVIINFHWGDESSYYPNQDQKEVAYAAIDFGADMVIGHHPHVIQGLEIYKDRPIAYSLGNFSFGGNSNPSDKRTFILQANLVIENNKMTKIGIRAIPASISSVSNQNNYQPTPMENADKDVLLQELNNLSVNLGFELSDEFHYIDITN